MFRELPRQVRRPDRGAGCRRSRSGRYARPIDALNASRASATVPDPPQMGRRGLSPRAQASHGAPMRPRRCPSLGGLAADRLHAALLPNLPRACAMVACVVESPPRAECTAHVREASAPIAAETTVPTEVVLATPIRLARGVKVAQVVLVHLVLVRIQAGQFRSRLSRTCRSGARAPRCRTIHPVQAAASSP